MASVEYVSYEHKYSKQFADIPTYDYVQLPKHVKKGAKKMLVVLDYMPTEDLTSGRLLSGATGKLFKSILKVANTFYNEENKLNDYDWLAVCHNAFKTAGQAESFKESAKDEFRRRLQKIITSYKPDVVLTFGNEPYRVLNGARLAKYDNKLYHLLGVPTKIEVKFKDTTHKCIHVPSLSLNNLITDNGSGNSMALAGYVSRNVVNALSDEPKYKIPKLKYKPVLVDSIEKFDKMMKEIKSKENLAIDTETENLNRRVNKMLTIQFAYSTDKAFVVPTYHKDSSFTSDELKYIQLKLRKFFEKTNQNKFHVFTNGKFDLTVIRNFCGVRFFKTDMWDIFAGEFCLDENVKNLRKLIGNSYYSLLNLSMQYGCTAYYDAEFGKDKRKTIYAVDLDDALIEYCCLDVIVPLYIQRLQLKRAKDIGYTKYSDIVGYQLSDMSHNFSTWEYNGCPTDIEYLFHLKTKDSPIRLELEKCKERLYASEGVRKANALLTKKSGAPVVGLMGRVDLKLFDISKQDHQQILFFDVLKLKPLMSSKANSKGVVKHKIDKKFQAKYDSVEEVKLYTALQKAKKLYNAYVKSLIKQWGVDDDMRFDSHIRPHFEFLDVVTGRTSAKKPSLQQVPSRGELGKHIKRLFIAESGRIMIKVDYSAHEVRCWSLLTGDKSVAALFETGRDLRRQYRLRPDPDLLKRIDLEGDVHKINAAYFFGVPIEQVDKPLRNAVKTVIFGLIYQQGMKGLSASTGQTVEAIEKLVKQFKKKHPIGVAWFDTVKQFARDNLYVESPLGRRRHTWGHLMPKNANKNADSVIARNERQSVNSPVQGIGSDFLINGARCIERLKYDHFDKTGHYPDFYQANSVHDSIIFSCAYEDIWVAIKIIEQGLTSEVARVTEERHGMEFIVPLEIDFEIGNNERDVVSWSGSLEQMDSIIKSCLKERQAENPKFDAKRIYRNVMQEQYEHMPDWCKKQAWNLGIKMKGMVVDPRTKEDKIKCKKQSKPEQKTEKVKAKKRA